MITVKVYVTYKNSVLDPQGEAVKKAIHRLGNENVTDVRIGKYFELTIKKTEKKIQDMIEELCDQLLANVTMETYRYEIVEEI